MNVAGLESTAWNLLDDNGTSYPEPVLLRALNEAQRLFCLMTLCLETTTTFTLTPNTAFYHMRAALTDWIKPRRIWNSNGQQVRAGTLSDLDAASPTWQTSSGPPVRYAHLGLDLLALYQQPAFADTLTITYAHAPALMVSPTDVPQIQENSHFALPNYAAYAVRQAEGAQEFSKFLGYFGDFLDEAQRVAALVRAKNKDLGYEMAPFELEHADRSRLVTA